MIPKENTIIVDEIGMVDKMGHDFIYKMHLLKKRIICYGDFNQLENIDGNIYNSKLYIKYMFGITDNMTANRRNKFSKEYYDKLIYNKNKKYLLGQVQKYNTDWEKAETIICYRNKTVDKYNKKMCDKLKIKYIDGTSLRIDTDNLKPGTKIICKSNKIKDFYNNFSYTIKKSNDNFVFLYDGIKEYKIKKEFVKLHFKFNYARTLHSVQGQTLESFHFPQEDSIFLNGKSTYTIISRLKF